MIGLQGRIPNTSAGNWEFEHMWYKMGAQKFKEPVQTYSLQILLPVRSPSMALSYIIRR